MRRIFPIILAAALCLCACDKNWNVLYRGMMFGTMQNYEEMLGDDGCTYRFTNLKDLEVTLPPSGRIVAMFDVYRKIEGTENHYEAEILNRWIPICNEPVMCDSDDDEAALGDDPIGLADGWWSGGHLILVLKLELREYTTVNHLVNLQIVPGEYEDTLHTVLRHNAAEDKVTEENSEFFSEQAVYACFPLEDKLPEQGSRVLEIKWFWDEEWHTTYAKISK